MQILKTTLLSALGLVALSTNALATPFFCGSTGNLANGTGSGSIVCSLDAGAGNIITSITLIRSADASTVLTGSPVVTFTWNAPSGVGVGAGGIVFTLTGQPVFGGNFSTSPVSPASVTFAGPGTQTASFSNDFSSSVIGGTLTSSSGVIGGDFTSQPDVPPSETPEPSSFIMLGSALTGLGLFARRRKA